jgi:hypothetical protein
MRFWGMAYGFEVGPPGGRYRGRFPGSFEKEVDVPVFVSHIVALTLPLKFQTWLVESGSPHMAKKSPSVGVTVNWSFISTWMMPEPS